MPDKISEIKVNAGKGKAVFIGKPDPAKLSAILEKPEINPDVAFKGNPHPNSGN